ncbi:MAG: hypothetical protein FD180_5131 [Planctomycetota bacterium]|nr:MAG: hypothetical protein FD180_5131 [Planctomycetota bacterium]
MGDVEGTKKSGGKVIFRPMPPKPGEPRGMRVAGCAAFLLTAAAAYAGAVVWLAHRGRAEADERVRKIPSLALASFGASSEALPGMLLAPPDPARAGAEMRSILEERLKRLKGKSFGCAVASAAAWEPLKAEERAGFAAVPPGTRVLDLHDPSTCVALRAMHGTEHFLRVLSTFSFNTHARPLAVVRLEASVFAKDAQLVWTDIFTESQEWTAPPADAPGRPDPQMNALRAAMFRAADHLGAALESEREAK